MQKENRQSPDLPDNFIKISAVKFNGISKESLDSWKENAIEKFGLDEEIASKFVETSMNIAQKLTQIGILKTTDNEKFTFVDQKSKEILFKHHKKSLNEILKINLESINKKEVVPKQPPTKENSKDDNSMEISKNQQKIITEFKEFNFSYKLGTQNIDTKEKEEKKLVAKIKKECKNSKLFKSTILNAIWAENDEILDEVAESIKKIRIQKDNPTNTIAQEAERMNKNNSKDLGL